MSEQQATYNVTYTDKSALNGAIQSELRRLVRTDSTTYKGPDSSLVRALIEGAGWQQNEVADLLRVNVSTVRRWTANAEQSQRREMPFSAWVVLLQATGYTAVETLAT